MVLKTKELKYTIVVPVSNFPSSLIAISGRIKSFSIFSIGLKVYPILSLSLDLFPVTFSDLILPN